LFFAWDPPDTIKQNGVIISYTACVSHSENEPCFQTFITSETKWFVGNLNPSTKYYVRVLASTKAGGGNYSESKGFFTNGRKYNTHVVYISIFFVILQENVFSEFCIYRMAQSFYVVLVKSCLLYLAHKTIRQTTLLPNLKNLYFTFLRILLCIINCHLSSCLMV
jgi:hypothetical protein